MKKLTEQRCAFCQYKCGEKGSYMLVAYGVEWFYCSDECLRRDLAIDNEEWEKIEKYNTASVHFKSRKFGAMVTRFNSLIESEKEEK